MKIAVSDISPRCFFERELYITKTPNLGKLGLELGAALLLSQCNNPSCKPGTCAESFWNKVRYVDLSFSIHNISGPSSIGHVGGLLRLVNSVVF